MWFWKHAKKPNLVVISHDDYNKLPEKHKKHFEKAPSLAEPTHDYEQGEGEDFGLSVAVGLMTDSAGMGYIAGRSLAGGMVGEMLAESLHQPDQQLDNYSGAPVGDYTPQADSVSMPDSTPAFDSSNSSTPDFSSGCDSTSVSSPDMGGGF